MMTFYYVTVAAIQAFLAVMMFRLGRKSGSIYPIFPLIVILGIIYDNLIIGFGSFIGEGELLKNLNVPRFVIHAFFTPMLMIFGFGVARRCGVGFAQSKGWHTAICVFTVLLILLGIYEELWKMNLAPLAEDGTLRYKTPNSPPPIPAIMTIMVAIIFGVFVWIKTKKPWYFLGSVGMFCLAPLAPNFVWAGNLGEIFMNLGSIFGEKAAQEREVKSKN
jgi:hypothetical protein